jgi:hypothetical protein
MIKQRQNSSQYEGGGSVYGGWEGREKREKTYLHLHNTTILKLFNERLLSLEIRIAHLKDFVTRVHIPLDAQLGLGKQQQILHVDKVDKSCSPPFYSSIPRANQLGRRRRGGGMKGGKDRRTISNIRTARKIKPQIHEIKALRDNIPNKPLQLGAGHLVGNILYIYPSCISLQPISTIENERKGHYLEHDSRPRIKTSFNLCNVHRVFLRVGDGIRVRWCTHRTHHGGPTSRQMPAARAISNKSAFPLPRMGT